MTDFSIFWLLGFVVAFILSNVLWYYVGVSDCDCTAVATSLKQYFEDNPNIDYLTVYKDGYVEEYSSEIRLQESL